MATAPILEGVWMAEWLLSEAPGNLSRHNVILVPGPALASGTVLGTLVVNSKVTQHTAVNTDGSETATAILLNNVPVRSVDTKVAVIDCNAEVKQALLIYAAGFTDPQKSAALVDLAKVFIKARV